MIRKERDPDFWIKVASHPEVRPALLGYEPEALREVVGRPNVLPLATTNGGFLFAFLDPLVRVAELHTLYTPEGWGREVLMGAKEAASIVLARAQMIVTYEIGGRWRTRPPRSFGFKACGDFEPGLGVSLKLWSLTQTDWNAKCQQQH